MVLDNFYKALIRSVMPTTESFQVIGGNNYSTTSLLPSFSSMNTCLKGSGAVSGVEFGNGSTPPTANDYTLSGDIITGISTSSTNVKYSVDGNLRTATCTYTISNDNESDITISEIGYFSKGGSSRGNIALLDRTVLDSPVTIPAGGVGKVTYTISVTLPTS